MHHRCAASGVEESCKTKVFSNHRQLPYFAILFLRHRPVEVRTHGGNFGGSGSEHQMAAGDTTAGSAPGGHGLLATQTGHLTRFTVPLRRPQTRGLPPDAFAPWPASRFPPGGWLTPPPPRCAWHPPTGQAAGQALPGWWGAPRLDVAFRLVL